MTLFSADRSEKYGKKFLRGKNNEKCKLRLRLVLNFFYFTTVMNQVI